MEMDQTYNNVVSYHCCCWIDCILVDNVNATGIVTAQQFIGDGSGITGITASGTGIIIRDDGTLVGTIGTVNFGTGFSVSLHLLVL